MVPILLACARHAPVTWAKRTIQPGVEVIAVRENQRMTLLVGISQQREREERVPHKRPCEQGGSVPTRMLGVDEWML